MNRRLIVVSALVAYLNIPAFAISQVNGVYHLRSVNDWNDMAAIVNNGSEISVVMDNDISLGDSRIMWDGFTGYFNGNGHTLTVNYESAVLRCAPFRNINCATIENLNTAGSITSSSTQCAGIVANINKGATVSVIACSSSIVFNLSFDGELTCAGIVARASDAGQLIVSDCLFDGEFRFYGENAKSLSGILGYANNAEAVSVTNCLNVGRIIPPDNFELTPEVAGARSFGGIKRGNVTLEGNWVYNPYGHWYIANQAEPVTDLQLESGATAFQLQAYRSEIVWGQTGLHTSYADKYPRPTIEPDCRVVKLIAIEDPNAGMSPKQVVDIRLELSKEYQFVNGFGAMHYPKVWGIQNVPSSELIRHAYSDEGLGYNIMRLMVYPDSKDFGIDLQAAKTACDAGAIILACPWWCKEEWRETSGNKTILKKSHYEDYANHLCSFVSYMKGNGVDIYAITCQNEPDGDFLYWTSNDIADFIKTYGKKIRATGVKLMGPETMGINSEYNDAVLTDEAVFANVDLMACHLYTGFLGDSQYPTSLRLQLEKYYNNHLQPNGKGWWMTEHLFNDGADESDIENQRYRSWEYNITHLGREIHECMTRGCSAYIYWYLKRFYGLFGDATEQSPVNEDLPAKNGFILSHFAIGAKNRLRVEASCPEYPKDILVTAYKTTSGNEVTFVLQSTLAQPVSIRLPICATEVSAYATSCTYSYKAMSSQLDNQQVVVTLPAESILTVHIKLSGISQFVSQIAESRSKIDSYIENKHIIYSNPNGRLPEASLFGNYTRYVNGEGRNFEQAPYKDAVIYLTDNSSDDASTSIVNVSSENLQSNSIDNRIYNLQGIQVGTINDLKGLSVGIYILNGKKFLKTN